MTPLKWTVAVKGMTVFKEVHTKELQKELGESAQRKKNVHLQVKNQSICTVCTNKSLGFTFNTYTPIVIPSVTILTGPSESHTRLAKSIHNKEVLVGNSVSIPESKFSLRCCLRSSCCKSQDAAWKAVAMAKRPQSALPLCCTIGMTVTTRLLSRTAGRQRRTNISRINGDSDPESYTSIH